MQKYADFFCLLHSPIVSLQLRVICTVINDENNELLSYLHHQFAMMISKKSSVSRALARFLFDIL